MYATTPIRCSSNIALAIRATIVSGDTYPQDNRILAT